MPSSSRPYQSKVLRFVLKQWQQGWERQDRAWRQVQSTTTWGAQVAVLPFYAIIQAMKRANFAIGSSTPQPDQPITPAESKVTDITHSFTAILAHTQQLLSTEQKDQLAIRPKGTVIHQRPSLLGNIVASIRQLQPGKRRATDQTTAIARRKSNRIRNVHPLNLSSNLGAHTASGLDRRESSTLFQNGTTLASSLKTRNLVLVNLKNEVFDIFTPAQQSDLQHYIARIMIAYERSRPRRQTITYRRPQQLPLKRPLALDGSTSLEPSLSAILTQAQTLLSKKQQNQLTSSPDNNLIHQAKTLLNRVVNQLWQPGKLTTTQSNNIHHKHSSKLIQNSITLASSLTDRQLVLVNLKNEIFDILTPTQQANLKDYIAWVLLTYQQDHYSTVIIPSQKPLSLKTILTISGVFITALPMELQKAWAQLAPSPKSPQLPHIKTNNRYAEPRSRIYYPKPSASGTIRTRARQLSHKTGTKRQLTSRSPDAFEANVNDVSYVDHPLERVLRWIDRLLTWCEQRWQKLSRANMG